MLPYNLCPNLAPGRLTLLCLFVPFTGRLVAVGKLLLKLASMPKGTRPDYYIASDAADCKLPTTHMAKLSQAFGCGGTLLSIGVVCRWRCSLLQVHTLLQTRGLKGASVQCMLTCCFWRMFLFDTLAGSFPL